VSGRVRIAHPRPYLRVRNDTSFLTYALIERNPPARGVFLFTRFFKGDPLTHRSWWGNIVSRKPPRGRVLSISFLVTQRIDFLKNNFKAESCSCRQRNTRKWQTTHQQQRGLNLYNGGLTTVSNRSSYGLRGRWRIISDLASSSSAQSSSLWVLSRWWQADLKSIVKLYTHSGQCVRFLSTFLLRCFCFLTSVLFGSPLYLHWFYWEWFNLDASVIFFLGKSSIYVCDNMYACSHECFGRLRWRAFFYLSPSLSLTARARTQRTHTSFRAEAYVYTQSFWLVLHEQCNRRGGQVPV